MRNWLLPFFQAVFWAWNAGCLLVVGFGILPLIGLPLLQATQQGTVPIEFAGFLAVLVAVPIGFSGIGLAFRKQPLQLMRLFCGVEAPLFLLALLRLFVLRELTPASTQIFVGVGICMVVILADVVLRKRWRSSPARVVVWLHLITHSFVLLVGLYLGGLLLIYAIPLLMWLLQKGIEFEWVRSLWISVSSLNGFANMWVVVLGVLLVGLAGSLCLALPAAIAALYLRAGMRSVHQFAARFGQRRAWIGAGSTIALVLLVFSLQTQPQIQAFRLLDRPATLQNRPQLLAQSEQIRAGLLNAYLNAYRYLGIAGEANQIQVMYERIFGLPSGAARGLQALCNSLLSPFLYQGAAADSETAARRYAEFFDTPIQQGERAAINRALQSTVNRDEAEAEFMAFHQRRVWLKSQDVRVDEQGDWAAIELHEVYENQTATPQEVVYWFSLPESAVVTELWLGNTGDRASRFPFAVSAPGTSQLSDPQSLKEWDDLAWIEQVGPQQYCLHALPVPVRPNDTSRTPLRERPPTELHVWLTYQVMRQPQGWALPRLSERRNLYWTQATKRTRPNASSVRVDGWLESYLPAAKPGAAHAHFATIAAYQVTAKPIAEAAYVMPQNQRFAIVLDTSYSMQVHQQEIRQTFQWLRDRGFANNKFADNDADLYLTSAVGSVPQRIDDLSRFNVENQLFYGSLTIAQIVQQFAQLRGTTAYNSILLLTDAGGDLGTDQPVPSLSAPVWLIHFGTPPTSDSHLLHLLQLSRGGMAASMSSAVRRSATQAALGPPVLNIVDGYIWQIEGMTDPIERPPSQPLSFAPLAARQLLTRLVALPAASRVTPSDRPFSPEEPNSAQLAYRIAQTMQIVTPVSSLLVPTTKEQQAALQRPRGDYGDDSSTEPATERLPKPMNPLLSSLLVVPQSSGWGGVAVAAVAIGWQLHRRKQASLHRQ